MPALCAAGQVKDKRIAHLQHKNHLLERLWRARPAASQACADNDEHDEAPRSQLAQRSFRSLRNGGRATGSANGCKLVKRVSTVTAATTTAATTALALPPSDVRRADRARSHEAARGRAAKANRDRTAVLEAHARRYYDEY